MTRRRSDALQGGASSSARLSPCYRTDAGSSRSSEEDVMLDDEFSKHTAITPRLLQAAPNNKRTRESYVGGSAFGERIAPASDTSEDSAYSPSASRTQVRKSVDVQDIGSGNGAPHRRKRRQTSASQRQKDDRRAFACPFHKGDPLNPAYKGCATMSWAETSRVKEHLYRKHTMPTCCGRCAKMFKRDDDLQEHLQQQNLCEEWNFPTFYLGGMKSSQVDKLKSRKGLSCKSEEEKWIDIYQILFPDDAVDSIPSPYFEDLISVDGWSIRDYNSFLRRELPYIVAGALAKVKNTNSGAMSVESVVETSLLQLYRFFCSHPSPSTQSRSSTPTRQDFSDCSLTSYDGLASWDLPIHKDDFQAASTLTHLTGQTTARTLNPSFVSDPGVQYTWERTRVGCEDARDTLGSAQDSWSSFREGEVYTLGGWSTLGLSG